MTKLRSPGLDGLRGVAVAAVVIEHAWPKLLPGGFTGVDMFFVLSGFLITAQLLGEHQRTGAISLRAFYARRVRRIFPASLLVILVTGITWAILFGPGLANEAIRALSAASISLSNFYFQASSLDYFQAGSGSSPVLHYWSLAVEEQFYLAYPILLIVIDKLVKRYVAINNFPGVVGGALVVLSALSFGGMILSSPSAAFYLPWFRAWELGAGGITAYFIASQWSIAKAITARLRNALLVLGSVGLTVAFLLSETFIRWPGYESLIPVVSTSLLIIGLFGAPTSSKVFASTPLRFLGRISFALYLWHWVLLGIFDNLAIPNLRDNTATILAILAAFALATASTVLVEEPIRALKVDVSSRAKTTVLAGACSIFLTLGFINLGVPALARLADFDTPLAASLSQVREDFTRLRKEPGYFTVTGDYQPNYNPCEYGAAQIEHLSPDCDGTALPKIVLLGDSNALAWFPALNEWALENGYALIMLGRAACSPFNVESPPAGNPSNCTRWANEVWGRIKNIKPDLLVVSTSRFSKIVVGGATIFPSSGSPDWMRPAVSQLSGVHALGIPVLLIGDIPRATFNIPDCLAMRRTNPSACEISVADALPRSLVLNQQQVAASAGIDYWNPAESICPAGVCTWVRENQVMFIDPGHLSASVAASLKGSIGAVIRIMLSRVTP